LVSSEDLSWDQPQWILRDSCRPIWDIVVKVDLKIWRGTQKREQYRSWLLVYL
jgi:hypothetical protein